MIGTMKRHNLYIGLLLACLLPLISACEQEDVYNPSVHSGGLVIKAISEPMLEQTVTRSAGIAKEEAEKEIKSLHLFFFDAGGNYLAVKNPAVFNCYMKLDEGQALIRVPNDAFTDATAAASATVYAVANVEESTFGTLTEASVPSNVPDRRALENIVYKPSNYKNKPITQVPATGIPMIGKNANPLNLVQQTGEVLIELKALMARIDVSIQVNSEHGTMNLPRLSMVEWTVENMPTTVALTQRKNVELGTDKRTATIANVETVTNGNGQIDLSFYMFENLQDPATDPAQYSYPAGISDDDKQRWKPELADKNNATAFTMHAFYSTYNEDGSGNSTYEATFTFYLGANHTDDFKVARNRHYKNDITITGLNQVGNNPEHITFDARVNITEQNNPYFISMLRERDHDAHFCVTPMDIYLFDEEAHPSMTVSIDDPANHTWIRMERIPADNMLNGTVPNLANQLATGQRYCAGNGKRKYFTTTLMNELSGNTSYSSLEHRDRIYFYIDENLSTNERTATINIEYKDDNGTRNRTIEIRQNGLLRVYVPGDDDNDAQIIYVEAYEEYLNHYDPLNEHDGNDATYVYDGLEWGLNSFYLNMLEWRTGMNLIPYEQAYLDGDWQNVYYNGLEATANIVNKAGQVEMELNEKPASAAQYCYNKNKRNADGSVSNAKWFLPGIRQLEYILTTYYNQYSEFQENYYWSSSAGKEQVWLGPWSAVDFYPEDDNYARATKALSNGGYAASDWDNTYTGENGNGGKAPRAGTYLRIRAARTDLNPQ